MNRQIRTYNDLEREKNLLQELLLAQKELMNDDMRSLKEEMKPAASALNFLGKITTRERKNFLLTEGVNKIIDIVMNKLVLARSGWITRMMVPFFMKNYSSHFISNHKDEIVDKLVSLFTGKHTNGQAAPEMKDLGKTGS